MTASASRRKSNGWSARSRPDPTRGAGHRRFQLLALAESGRKREDIAFLASAWLKQEEEGLLEAAKVLDREIVFLSRDELNSQEPSTPSRAEDLGLAGVAEPAVLALAKRLILPKKAYGRVTVAIGEN